MKESTIQIAEELHAIGWTSPNDAQWVGLEKWLDEKRLIPESQACRREVLEKCLEQLEWLDMKAETSWLGARDAIRDARAELERTA